ncbi:MAG TPA: Wzz/FepE/Etk N-terminal domain-containing protein [Candidatus Binataceae bacterium]|nr:Wzz/FepE/Etk N-terminal domain-containing protein [Candidatus Binataceae bacterium]
MGRQTLEFWIEMLCRRWVVALQAGLLTFGAVALGSLLLPPTYQSVAKVLVESNRAQLLVSPGLQQDSPNQPSAMTSPVSEQDLNSEVELLSSPLLIRRALDGVEEKTRRGLAAAAVDYLRLVWALPEAGYHALHDVPELTARDEWANKIERNLSTSVIKRSNVIEVEFRSRDPRWSAAFLGRLLSRYLELHARISHDTQAEKFFETQRTLLEERLHSAQEKLRGAQLQTGITEVGAQRQALITQLYAAEADYRKTNASLDAANERAASIQAQMARTPQRRAKEAKVVQNMALQQLKPQVLQLESERAELLSRYQPTSARIREIDAKLIAARQIVEREGHHEVQESTTDVNPTWESLDSDLADARSEAASLKATQVAQAKQLEGLRQQLKNLAGDGVLIERLELQVDSDKQAFMAYVRKGEEARAAEALNRSQILNVTVVQDPVAPLEPVFPKVGLNLLAGLLVALVFASGAAYWAETRDPRICSMAAISEATGLPTVAVIGNRV